MVARRHRLAVVAFAAVSLAAVSLAPRAEALSFGRCNDSVEFRCATLTLPLDRSGANPGSVKLRLAAQSHYRPGAGLLIALAGGPGQGAVQFADGFAQALSPMLRRYRLVVIDQRGTGASGALSCPKLQKISEVAVLTPADVRDCAELIGPRRRFYSTLDSVADLDAVRRAFGAPKLALIGVSYGTWVAEQYARIHPATTDSLILDSVVGPAPPNGFYLDSLAAVPRVTAERCAGTRCDGITKDPVGDLTSVVKRAAQEPLKGTVFDLNGRAVKAHYYGEDEIRAIVESADINPALQAQLPAAFAAAHGGDYAQILRLWPAVVGRPVKTTDLSVGLNLMTGCLDYALPYPLSSETGQRPALNAAALSAVPTSDYRPFSASSVASTSTSSDCLLFPPQADRAAAAGPLPKVPTLILAGQLDLRTPVENARATAALIPGSSLVELRGAGHNMLDRDGTGCVQLALKRFAARRAVGSPCANRNNAERPVQIAPRSLAAVSPLPGVHGAAGRALAATLAAVDDAIANGYLRYYAGIAARGGGLRGGSYDLRQGPFSRLILRRYSYVDGLAVSGTLKLASAGPKGTLKVSGAASGSLTLRSSRSVRGVLNGRAINWSGSASAAKAPARSSGPPRRLLR